MLNVLKYDPLNITIFLLFNILNIFLNNKIITKIFKLEKRKEIKLFIIKAITILGLSLFIPYEFLSLLNIISDLILYKIIFKFETEKICISIFIELLIKTISEVIIIFYKITNLNVELIFSTYLLETILNCIILIVLTHNKIVIDLNGYLKEKQKNKVKLITIISILLIEITKIKVIEDIKYLQTSIFILIYFLLISFLSILIKTIFSIIKENDNNIKIENLEGSNKRLQENYDNVRAFKHDFNNIMQGIGGYIVSNDIDGLKKMYNSITSECQEINEKQSINENIINNPAILNLINNKIKIAEKNDIKVKLEVYVDLNTLNISTYDLCRVLGILIDNAIEATISCNENRVISIKFLKDKYNNRNLIIIENPCKNFLIDVKKIYEKGFSSKKDKFSHGLGLWKVKQILKKNRNIQIYTSRDKFFKQQLEIY